MQAGPPLHSCYNSHSAYNINVRCLCLSSVFLRFRLRYSTANDCYYLHYDQSVCPPLARITGLAKGAMNVTGLTRYTDQESKMVRNHCYLGNAPIIHYCNFPLNWGMHECVCCGHTKNG